MIYLLRTELPSLLPIIEVAEALLHVRNGEWFLCLLVANVPDSFSEGMSIICWNIMILQILNLKQKLLIH